MLKSQKNGLSEQCCELLFINRWVGGWVGGALHVQTGDKSINESSAFLPPEPFCGVVHAVSSGGGLGVEL